MFTQLKDRFAEKLRNLGPQDEKDKQIQYLVDLGTQESLQGPNWVANMELVDVVNQSPEIACEKVLRILNRSLAKPVVRTQVLVLTMLDTCVRNCYPVFHAHLAQSVLWADLLKLVQDKSVNRIDLEVRDKILSMVEDYGKYLKHPPLFTEAYENLVDQGIDFPVRASNEVVPIEVVIPPPPPPGSTDPSNLTGLPMSAPATGGVANAGAAPATGTGIFSNFFNTFGTVAANGAAPPGGSPPVSGVVTGGMPGTTPTRPNARRGGVDPAVLEGLSPEDKAAVEAAMAEMALELESAQEAAAIAASLQTAAQEGGGANAGAIPQLPTSTPASAVQSPGATGLVPLPVPAPGSGAPLARAPSTPALPDDPTEALLVINNSVGLLTDLLGSIPDSDPSGVRDPLVRDLAEQCGGYRSRLTQMAEGITDEELLISALNQNDALTTVMARYDALLAQALSVGPNPASPADDTAARLAVAASAISQGDALTSAAPNFTLLDEDEEDGPGLTTTRNQNVAAVPAASPTPVATDDLADLFADAVQPAATTTGPEHAQSATAPATAVPKLPPSEPLI